MDNTNWHELSGDIVMPFTFSEHERQQISNEAVKHIVDENMLSEMLQQLEAIAELYKHRKDDFVENDDRRTTIRKLQKVLNGLTKTIDALQSLDAQTQDSFDRYVFLTKSKTNFSVSEHMRANPVTHLIIYRDAVQSLLESLQHAKYMRAGRQNYLATEILKWWFRYTDRSEFQSGGRNAWLDHKAGKCNSAVSVMLITKTVLAACGTPIEDPTNYIVQASESMKVMA